MLLYKLVFTFITVVYVPSKHEFITLGTSKKILSFYIWNEFRFLVTQW